MVNDDINNYVPGRGDIIEIDFNPQTGKEQAGKRPALVLSPEKYNGKTGLAIMCPITNQIKGYPFEVRLPQSQKCTGVILSDHIKNLDWQSRNAKFIERISLKTLDEVLSKLAAILGQN
ncbi:endoribonuclease MazF [Candidatus Peregrinibacteria bacterium]|nr:endoribonuclease MazF [Candidatus Peregrinibacteria bacterium]